MKKRSYKITACLREGYSGSGAHHTVTEARNTVETWMRKRLQAGMATVSGLLTEGLLIFPSPNREESGDLISKSPTIIYAGELSSPEDGARSDEEVAGTLESLATALKKVLEQEAVYIVYGNRNWAI